MQPRRGGKQLEIVQDDTPTVGCGPPSWPESPASFQWAQVSLFCTWGQAQEISLAGAAGPLGKLDVA